MIRKASLQCLAWLAFAVPVQADLIIDVQQDAVLSANGTGYVDVYLTGGPEDTLGRFGYEFQITGATPQSGDLQFQATQSPSEQSISVPLPPYVFLGDTDSDNFISSPLDPVTLVGSDMLATGNDVSVNGNFLLARLELQHVGTMSVPSHAFTVSLVPSSPNTVFDKDYEPSNDTNYAPANITSLSGTVTVQSAAVPEPTGMVAVATLILGAWGIRRKRQSSTLALSHS